MLIVKDASPEDDDEYICIAENRAGAAKASAKVQVHCKAITENFGYSDESVTVADCHSIR